jgi:hypothetical protein
MERESDGDGGREIAREMEGGREGGRKEGRKEGTSSEDERRVWIGLLLLTVPAIAPRPSVASLRSRLPCRPSRSLRSCTHSNRATSTSEDQGGGSRNARLVCAKGHSEQRTWRPGRTWEWLPVEELLHEVHHRLVGLARALVALRGDGAWAAVAAA